MCIVPVIWWFPIIPFLDNSAKPLRAWTLESINPRQEGHGIFKDFRELSLVQGQKQKDLYKSTAKFYKPKYFICFWFQQKIDFLQKFL